MKDFCLYQLRSFFSEAGGVHFRNFTCDYFICARKTPFSLSRVPIEHDVEWKKNHLFIHLLFCVEFLGSSTRPNVNKTQDSKSCCSNHTVYQLGWWLHDQISLLKKVIGCLLSASRLRETTPKQIVIKNKLSTTSFSLLCQYNVKQTGNGKQKIHQLKQTNNNNKYSRLSHDVVTCWSRRFDYFKAPTNSQMWQNKHTKGVMGNLYIFIYIFQSQHSNLPVKR